MKQKLFGLLLAIVIFLLMPLTYAYALDDEMVINSTHALLIETDRGQVFYNKNSDQEIRSTLAAIAMTAILFIETTDKPSVVTISSIINEAPGRTVDISAGDRYSIESLLNILILQSAPDIALVLIESISQSTQSFISRMNDKAISIGMSDSLFSISKGANIDLTASTTLDDFAKLLLYCLRNQTFWNIFTSRFYIWQKDDLTSEIIANSNDILWESDHVTGGMKSNRTLSSDSTIITTSSRNNLNLLCIISENTRPSYASDAGTLFDYAYDHYRRGILAAANKPLTSIALDGEIINLSPNSDIHYTYPIGYSFIDSVEFIIPENIEIPVYKNIAIGNAVYKLVDGTTINVMLYPDKDIVPQETALDRFFEKLAEQRDLTTVVVILIIIEILWAVFKLIKRHQHKNNAGA